MKPIYCARCGAVLSATLKALRKSQRIITVVEPHDCRDTEVPEIDFDDIITAPKPPEKSFGDFDFVKKIDNDNANVKVELPETGDKRDKKHLREELITSSAPQGIFQNIGVNAKPKQKPDLVPNAEDFKEIEDV